MHNSKRLNSNVKSLLSGSEPLFVKIRTQNKDKLKKCTGCEHVWELYFLNNKILRVEDFPIYGLKREIFKIAKLQIDSRHPR